MLYIIRRIKNRLAVFFVYKTNKNPVFINIIYLNRCLI